MNRSALKTYAPKARLDFLRAVTNRAAFFGLTPKRTEAIQEAGDVVIIGGRAFPKVVAQQRRSLEARVQRQGFDQVMEAMAYTWFNRFVALRYMELHGYLDHGYRVLSHPEGKATPEIVEHAEHVTLPGLDAQQVINLKLDGTKEADLYRLLLVAQCNALHEAMPFLFAKIADETELLLPDNLLHSDSVIRKLINEIEEAEWQQVEIIGWLYQFYISDKKDEVIGKVVKSEDIPAATQLFTPNWIVKYLVQNTLGRQWLATYPASPLRQQMEYYIEPAQQTEEVKSQLAAITPKSLDPEALTLLDPASGSGHILVEAYDLFKAIYQERGYRSKDIPRLVLQRNLFGLEIDERAAQLAAFALLMKARADDRRIFADRIQPNVVAIQESQGMENLLRPDPAAHAAVAGELPSAVSDLFPQTPKPLPLNKPTQCSPLAAVEPSLRELIKLFEHGKTFGSLIRVRPGLAAQLPAARESIEAMIAKGQLWEHRAAAMLLPLVRQAEMLARTYDAVATNPPYMGVHGTNRLLKEFGASEYPTTKADLFSMFIERCLAFGHQNGFCGMITMHSWMFLSTFGQLRVGLLTRNTLLNLLHLGARAFSEISGEVVQTAAFSLCMAHVKHFMPTFYDLTNGDETSKRQNLRSRNGVFRAATAEDFLVISGAPITYWLRDNTRNAYRQHPPLSSKTPPKVGMSTGCNQEFIMFWHEVPFPRIGFGLQTRDARYRFYPHNKAGGATKWYGEQRTVLKYSDADISKMEMMPGFRHDNAADYFRECVSWSKICTSGFVARYYPTGFTFNSAAVCIFPAHPMRYLGFLNSKVFAHLVGAVCQTLNFTVGDVAKVPTLDMLPDVDGIVAELVEVFRKDHNRNEVSWEFVAHAVFEYRRCSESIADAWEKYAASQRTALSRALSLENENNRILLQAYGLDTEANGVVSESDITLERADRQQDMQRIASYAIGCMMGRYSLDKPGLIYAHSRNVGFDPSQYCVFPADADGIIPITELAWFPDDATERLVEFIAKAWPREHLEENLKFIAESLGPNRDEHPRDTIRRYLATGFYKDHLSTYKKRPIYWLFSSGKQRAFQCLVYLHRYHEGTLARMRTDYVIPLQGKIVHRIEQLAGDIAAATSTSHRRRLEKEKETLVKQSTELAAFDEKLRHYADQRIALDLDDGVKVNYGKFGDLLAEVKTVTGGTEE